MDACSQIARTMALLPVNSKLPQFMPASLAMRRRDRDDEDEDDDAGQQPPSPSTPMAGRTHGASL